MRSGVRELSPGELDLKTTMEVGQTFAWHKTNGHQLYDEPGNEYYTTRDGNVLILRQEGNELHWRATGGMEAEIDRRLRLHESLAEITAALQGRDTVLDEALQNYPGMRVLNDDVFPCLISYLCSAQMRIPRIKEMYDAICDTFGTPVEVNGVQYRQFPTVDELAAADEDRLRSLGIGYRAKYIDQTTDQLMDGLIELDTLSDLPYHKAHDEIKQLYGVGDKIADCVLLFGAGQLQAFPIDTWIKKAIKHHYPDKHADDYHTIGDNFRDHFGDHIGYAQEYLFHHVRNNWDPSTAD